ncbi:hypothetical protein [Leptospira borgpetersenii]|uniref:Dolichyl-phosphate-mannose-protein mannosyltransferase n=1 Tax=Leptospira borgpetersenii serovar Hardjo-bovis (strain JB197) TaxID=355277 RepID=Q04QP6_LEPBJ|nr:hypothetical protein [Leptospira borgpetersenii]ABJ76774.1 Hypothetical protein LBJ_2301 [Leptospira borgpetersenii serovar Hardjo-bovis str. JB197]AMX72014.1 membrane protein [Leptospira borgpetersenii serovar Hardjo]TQE57747.1 hypothetical protein FFZ96_06040 [Leptospira borgpetersenii]
MKKVKNLPRKNVMPSPADSDLPATKNPNFRTNRKFLIPGILICLFSLGLAFYMGFRNWEIFIRTCTLKDLLTWDENIRLNVVLDQYQDFREFRIWRALFPFLESPTWPPLRSFLSLILLMIPGDMPITWKDSFLGLVFYVICFPSILYIVYKITGYFWKAGLTSILTLALTLHTTEAPSYSLSSMLETQGMFFLLWVYYILYKIYSWTEQNPFRSEFDKTERIELSVFLSLFGLFFTKYPYGLLLFIAIFLYEIVSKPKEYFEILKFSLAQRYKGFRRLFIVIVVLLVFSLPILRVVTNINLDQRQFKLIIYYCTVLLFIDFNLFLYKRREEWKRIAPSSIRIVYLYAIAPSLTWIFANPDRVMSLINAQMIVNEYVKSFTLALFSSPTTTSPVSHVFQEPWTFRFFFFGVAVLIFSFFREKIKTGNGNPVSSITRTLKDPLVAVTSILFLQYIIIDLTTGNKQLRHVFPPLPVLFTILSLWVFRFIEDTSKFVRYTAIGFGLFVFIWGGSLYVREGGLLRDSFEKVQHFCLKGFQTDLFQPARDLATKISPEGKYIVFNGFHEDFNFDTKGRLVASEIDLLMRMKTFIKGKYRNDSRHKWKSWDEFSSALIISPTCGQKEMMNKFAIRSAAVGKSTTLKKEYKHPSGDFCLREYSIQ